MKIKAIITGDGKMYKQVKQAKEKHICIDCIFYNKDDNCLDSTCCPDLGNTWEEVPEITDEEINKISSDYTEQHYGKRKVDVYIHEAFIAGIRFYKQQFKQKLEE